MKVVVFELARPLLKLLLLLSSQVPSLSYYVCEDACIRIACPKTGNIVCVMMSPEWKRIKDAICVPTEGNNLFFYTIGLRKN